MYEQISGEHVYNNAMCLQCFVLNATQQTTRKLFNPLNPGLNIICYFWHYY